MREQLGQRYSAFTRQPESNLLDRGGRRHPRSEKLRAVGRTPAHESPRTKGYLVAQRRSARADPQVCATFQAVLAQLAETACFAAYCKYWHTTPDKKIERMENFGRNGPGEGDPSILRNSSITTEGFRDAGVF